MCFACGPLLHSGQWFARTFSSQLLPILHSPPNLCLQCDLTTWIKTEWLSWLPLPVKMFNTNSSIFIEERWELAAAEPNSQLLTPPAPPAVCVSDCKSSTSAVFKHILVTRQSKIHLNTLKHRTIQKTTLHGCWVLRFQTRKSPLIHLAICPKEIVFFNRL